MPIYEYECGRCKSRFELKQGFKDEAKAVCPQCKAKAKRVFQPTPIIFKGSGFYVTDHPKTDGSGTAKRNSSAAKAETGKTGSIESSPSKSN